MNSRTNVNDNAWLLDARGVLADTIAGKPAPIGVVVLAQNCGYFGYSGGKLVLSATGACSRSAMGMALTARHNSSPCQYWPLSL